MYRIQIDNDIFEIPEGWHELTQRELLYLAKLTQQDISCQELKLKMMLYHLRGKVSYHRDIYRDTFKIKIGQCRSKVKLSLRRKSYLLTPDHVNQLTGLYNFLYTLDESANGEKKNLIVPNIDNANPFPLISIYFRKFKGAAQQSMYDISFEQFMFLNTYLNALKDSPEMIGHVLACVWYRGDAWRADKIEANAFWLNKLSAEKRIVMYWFITSCLNTWAEMFPDIFSGGGSSNNGVFDSQQRLLNMLANGDITKKMDVRKSNVVDAFYVIDEAVKRKKESEKK